MAGSGGTISYIAPDLKRVPMGNQYAAFVSIVFSGTTCNLNAAATGFQYITAFQPGANTMTAAYQSNFNTVSATTNAPGGIWFSNVAALDVMHAIIYGR